jgi:hypothetical protein
VKAGRSFMIENTSSAPLLVHVEPEGVLVSVIEGALIEVIDDYVSKPVILRVGKSRDSGETTISIWPGDGNTIVLIDGQDPLAARRGN